MGNIYREIVSKKKTKSIIFIVLSISLSISLSKFFSSLKGIDKREKLLIDIFFTGITVLFIAYQIFQCTVKYKYSIMLDKFMVHRVYSNIQVNLADVDLKDIVYIGKASNNKFSCKRFCKKLFMCDIISDGIYCCVYKCEDGYKKFYFKPSKKLIDKIEMLKLKEVETEIAC